MITLGDFSGIKLDSPGSHGLTPKDSRYARAMELWNALLSNPQSSSGLQAKFIADRAEYENLVSSIIPVKTATITPKAPVAVAKTRALPRPEGQDVVSSTRVFTAQKPSSNAKKIAVAGAAIGALWLLTRS